MQEKSIRSCVICKKKEEKNKLNRFIINIDDNIVYDEYKILSGRGGYLCNKCFLQYKNSTPNNTNLILRKVIKRNEKRKVKIKS